MSNSSKAHELRVLIIDDEPFLLKLLASSLRSLGHRGVISCEGGEQAIEELRAPKRPPDLIICDLEMPDVDGVEVVRWVRSCGLEKLEKLPILILMSVVRIFGPVGWVN